MENKKIIIDGVDVSGCELYRDDNGVFAPDGTAERTELCYLTNDYCGNSLNCYYKQLKRKEQECVQLKAENEILEKVNKANQEKIKKLNEQLEEEFIAKQYGDEALFFTLMNIKEICNNNDELQGDFNLVDCDKYKLGKHNLAKKILEEIKVVIDE